MPRTRLAKKEKPQPSIAGYRVIFTGFRNPDLEEAIESAGGRVHSSIPVDAGPGDTVVVALDTAGDSQKLDIAASRGLTIWDLALFAWHYDFSRIQGILKIPHPKMSGGNPVYYTHDNGGRPFRVEIDKRAKTASITKDNTVNYRTPVITVHFSKYWVGSGWMYQFPGAEEAFDVTVGSALLFQVGPHRYLQVSQDIYEFEAPDEIVEFHANLGNSDVNYPYAVGTQNTYLFLENHFIPNILRHDGVEPYSQYYGFDLPKTKKLRKPDPRYPPIHIVRKVQGRLGWEDVETP